jgi:exopolyphosphatase/guanosine-5'-triphosphate,3'-diphosphate pyrophosphatase
MVAALDLGSNSFHMIVARIVGGKLQVVDRLREPVRLAAGLDENNKITSDAEQRTLDCLARFGQRLQDLPRRRVRAVGTNALRQAANASSFLTKARRALGHRIEIISGSEEARLIYLGVAHALSAEEGRRLVIDIGGGSTECVIGERFAPMQRDSLFMGCVSFSRQFFGEGTITPKAMRAAEIAAALEVRSLRQRFLELGWQQCIGASGTILAVCEILRCATMAGNGAGGITLKGLRRLKKQLLSAGHVDQLKLQALSADRAPVFPGGVAILLALFEGLSIDVMQASQGALKEGLLYDLLGRIQHEDVRDQSVSHIAQLHKVDIQHAEQVERTVMTLFNQAKLNWRLNGESSRLLGWAARLHEIGLSVAYTGYHKHGAYLVQNSDMPGFSRQDQEAIATLVRCQRRRIKSDRFRILGSQAKSAKRLAVLLRLGILLNRERTGMLPPYALAVVKDQLQLSFPEGWLDEHPLTRADLEQEAQRLQEGLGMNLEFC